MYRHTPSSFIKEGFTQWGAPVIRWIWRNSFPCIITKEQGFTGYNILACTEGTLWRSPINYRLNQISIIIIITIMTVLLNNIVILYGLVWWAGEKREWCAYACMYVRIEGNSWGGRVSWILSIKIRPMKNLYSVKWAWLPAPVNIILWKNEDRLSAKIWLR